MLTENSDVFSFGVVLFEIICGRSPINANLAEEELNLIQWVISRLIYDFNVHLLLLNINNYSKTHLQVTPYVKMDENSGQIAVIIDKRLGGNYDMQSITGIAKLALRCVDPSPSCRPSVSEVVAEIKEVIAHESNGPLRNSEETGIQCRDLQACHIPSRVDLSQPKDMEWGDNSSNLPDVGR